MKKNNPPDCAACAVPVRERICLTPGGKMSKNCPTISKKKLLWRAGKIYEKRETGEFARQASIQEGECYAGRDKKPYLTNPTKPRIQEIGEFARKMGYIRLGLVFCAGLAKEAAVVADIFKKHGFEVISVICKAGAIPKEAIGVKDSEKIFIGQHETMCNPILQALIVNEAKTHFNILLGLCVGHDSLFFKNSQAPTTVLAVKDRVTGHNPLAAVYLADSYFRRITL